MYQKRKRIILDTLEKQGEVEVKELAQLLETSEITVRRDLAQLAADGHLERTHGGAMKSVAEPIPFTFVGKSSANIEAKEKIAQAAAAEVKEGEVIFMDCGSTVFCMCKYIKHKTVVVITNSLSVMRELAGTAVHLNLIGGELDAQRQATHGRVAEEHIGRYHADRAFLGADGVSAEKGLSAASEKEAGITLAMAAQATRTYLLCDKTKLNRIAYLLFAPLTIAQVLVTNASAEQVLPYEKAGLKIVRELKK